MIATRCNSACATRSSWKPHVQVTIKVFARYSRGKQSGPPPVKSKGRPRDREESSAQRWAKSGTDSECVWNIQSPQSSVPLFVPTVFPWLLSSPRHLRRCGSGFLLLRSFLRDLPLFLGLDSVLNDGWVEEWLRYIFRGDLNNCHPNK